MKLSDYTHLCINSCLSMISAKRKITNIQDLPPKSSYNLKTKIWLPCFSLKTGREKNSSSISSEIYMLISMEILKNSTKPSVSSSNLRTALVSSFRSSLKKYPQRERSSKRTTKPLLDCWLRVSVQNSRLERILIPNTSLSWWKRSNLPNL